VALAPGELVDDALARGTAAAGRWLKKNFSTIQWVIIGAAAAGVGYGVYVYRGERRAEAASAGLVQAIEKERGRISDKPESASGAEGKNGEDDTTPTFKSADERRAAALSAYQAASGKAPGSGPAILARLGEAGLLLDKHDWDGAVAAYREVKSSKLAAADIDVRGRAIEGTGYALEGKGDIDGAIAAFHELENTDAKGLKDLGLYHQARVLYARNKEGDRDKAKTLLKTAHDHLEAAAAETSKSAGPAANAQGPHYTFLQNQVDDLLRRIDPAALPSSAPPEMPEMGMASGGGGGVDPAQMKALQEQLQRQLKAHSKGGAPPGAPAPGTPPAPAGGGAAP
jgi:tetratricopeptide (TPR) repeat protein